MGKKSGGIIKTALTIGAVALTGGVAAGAVAPGLLGVAAAGAAVGTGALNTPKVPGLPAIPALPPAVDPLAIAEGVKKNRRRAGAVGTQERRVSTPSLLSDDFSNTLLGD